MKRVHFCGKAVWVGLILAMWVLAGCGTQGEVKDVAAPPMWFNPQMKQVCHTKSLLVTTELPESLVKDKSKLTLLVKMRTHVYIEQRGSEKAVWTMFSPGIKINDKVSFYLHPEPYKEIQYRMIEIDRSYLQPGMNSITITSSLDGLCASPCCPISIGFAFEDDPRIPFI